MSVSVKMTHTRTAAGKKATATLFSLAKSYSLVGFPQGNPKNSREKADGPTNAELAAIHTFGSEKQGIPQRPFMQETAKDAETRNEMQKVQSKLLPHVMRGAVSVKQFMAAIGEVYTGGIKKKIEEGDWVENSPRTIAQKGSSRPLIDTRQMVNSVTHREVVA